MKKPSILTTMLSKVSNITWLKNITPTPHKHMKPSKGFNQPVSDHAFDYLKELNDEEFEKLISMIFKQRGYSIVENNNMAIDLVLKMDGETTFIHYAHWREYKVDVIAIEKLSDVMDEESATRGIVITTGTFTDDALDFISKKHILLINGIDLSQMIEVITSSAPSELEELSDESTDMVKDEMPELDPLCPICSREMIKRTARKGKNAGNTFWGCSQFPNCRGVISE